MNDGGKDPYVIQVKICMCVLGSWKKLGGGRDREKIHNDLILFFGGLPVKPRKVTLSAHHSEPHATCYLSEVLHVSFITAGRGTVKCGSLQQ